MAHANEMTIVSWGGAYSHHSKSLPRPLFGKDRRQDHQRRISAEAVAKLRAMNEAGNVTWDVVDVVAADALRLCDEGLAMEIDPDTMLADGARRHKSIRRLWRPVGLRLLHPTDRVFHNCRLPHRPGWRHSPNRHLRSLRHRSLPRQAFLGKASNQQHGMGFAV